MPKRYRWQFDVVLADPPWNWKARSVKGEGRSAKKHYPVMELDRIKDMPIHVLAKPDSVLLLWAIDPMVPQALEVMAAWGYTFKTIGFYWVKENAKKGGFFTGLGYYTRANPEMCLLGTRGKGLAVVRHDVACLVVSPRGRHSEKPAEVRTRIERLFGRVRRLEVFARQRAEGWSAFGNEIKSNVAIPMRRDD
jgi:N6-adenosine-specific RNA methylase IME4